jgi:hypothetical protein
MKATDLKKGTKIQGANGRIFEIEKVTEKRISWFVGFSFKGGNGVNTMKMTWASIKQAQYWIDNGEWNILN